MDKSEPDHTPLWYSPGGRGAGKVAKSMLPEPTFKPRSLLSPESQSSLRSSSSPRIPSSPPSQQSTRCYGQRSVRGTCARSTSVAKCINSPETSDTTTGTVWDWQRHDVPGWERRRARRPQTVCSSLSRRLSTSMESNSHSANRWRLQFSVGLSSQVGSFPSGWRLSSPDCHPGVDSYHRPSEQGGENVLTRINHRHRPKSSTPS